MTYEMGFEITLMKLQPHLPVENYLMDVTI